MNAQKSKEQGEQSANQSGNQNGNWDGEGNFVLALRPYYQDTDAGGVVYHTRYIEFAERARNELLRALEHPTTKLTKQFHILFALRSLAAEWLAPAHLEDYLHIRTQPTAMSGARLLFKQSIHHADKTLVILNPVLVCIHTKTRAPARIPKPLVDSIQKRWPQLPKTTKT
ncbi:MAG: YbgC/FadM family acyl-CoA thioesterase [Alphaproteobacteria bacterium]